MQGPLEWIEDQAEVSQSDKAEKRLISFFSEDGGTIPVPNGKPDVTFGYMPFDMGAVTERKRRGPLRYETNRLPDIFWQQRVGSTAIDQKFHSPLTGRPGNNSFDVCDSHLVFQVYTQRSLARCTKR